MEKTHGQIWLNSCILSRKFNLYKRFQVIKETIIGVVDGIPNTGCSVFSGTTIDIERSMVPDGFSAPDAHGTEICSVIFNNDGNSALSPSIKGLSLPIFFKDNSGVTLRTASQVDIARALTIAVQRNVSIINVSAGQKTSTIEGGRHLEDALALCQKRRILVVGAAGNDGCACLHVPVAVPTVLAVGAMNGLGAPHDASNWGQAYSNNGIMAPGVDIEVVGPNNETARRSGTSFAAAVVTRTAAKLLTAAIDAGYPLDPIDIREILLQTVDPCVPGAGEDCNKVMAG